MGSEAYVKEDYEKALDLFQQAADRGNPDAQYMLGLMYVLGEGVEQSLEKGLEFLRAAAYLGNTDGIELLLQK